MNVFHSLVSVYQPSPFAFVTFFAQFLGYILFSTILQWLYYYRRGHSPSTWKVQHTISSGPLPSFWSFPIISQKPNRGIYHGALTCFNLCMASCFVALTTECSVKGVNRMRFDGLMTSRDVIHIVVEFVFICFYQCVVEYYWHRLMHLPIFYRNFHKYHHHYKAPEPWDDMYIHPLEACGYYSILYSPPFLFPIHVYAFLMYMALMGTCGVLDHSGIHFNILGIYNTADHDKHHEKFEVNYSFPFPFMDIWHDTFDGECMGKQYSSNRRRRALKST